MSTKRRRYKSYSPELKLEAVERALAGESVKVIAHHLDVTLKKYLQILKREGKLRNSKS
jgi:transposase